jgi:hypothetical protein
MGHALRLRLPVMALTASLAYFARLGAFPLEHPPYLPSSRDQGEIEGPTVEDMDLYNFSHSFRTRTVPRGPAFPETTDLPIISCPSACHDWDWVHSVAERLSGAALPCYTPGILTGKWRGTVLVRLSACSVAIR